MYSHRIYFNHHGDTLFFFEFDSTRVVLTRSSACWAGAAASITTTTTTTANLDQDDPYAQTDRIATTSTL